MKIFFIYTPINLKKGGSAIHGFNLAKYLQKKGHQIYSARELVIDGINLKRNFLFGLIRSDIVYIRLGFSKTNNFLARALCLIKKVVIELNAPSDELLLKGGTEQTISEIDRRFKRTLKKASRIIVVSEAIQTYCNDILGVENVYVVNNGGEKLHDTTKGLSSEFLHELKSIRDKFSKIVIWSGTNYPWQGFANLKEVIKHPDSLNTAFIIVSDDDVVLNTFKDQDNVFTYKELNRSEMASVILQSDIGCSFYGDFSKTRTGFYNSSLKFHEYLVNELGVIASPYPYFKKFKNENVLCSHNIEEVVHFIKNFEYQNVGPMRTWEDVAIDTENIIQAND